MPEEKEIAEANLQKRDVVPRIMNFDYKPQTTKNTLDTLLRMKAA